MPDKIPLMVESVTTKKKEKAEETETTFHVFARNQENYGIRVNLHLPKKPDYGVGTEMELKVTSKQTRHA